MHVGKKTLSALMALTLTASLAACSASTPADTTHAATPSENLVQTSSTPSVDEEGAQAPPSIPSPSPPITTTKSR